MNSKINFTGNNNPHIKVYILSQAVKHKSFPFDKYKRKSSDAEAEEQMVFLQENPVNIA